MPTRGLFWQPRNWERCRALSCQTDSLRCAATAELLRPDAAGVGQNGCPAVWLRPRTGRSDGEARRTGVRDAEAPLDYPAAVARRDQLAESADRNMLGQLRGDAALWQKVVAAYEKGGDHPPCSPLRPLPLPQPRRARSGIQSRC